MTQTSTETRSPHFSRDATATTYRDIHLPRVFDPWARILLEIVRPTPGAAVLDIACGPGTVARQAAAIVGPAGRVVGVDISPAMLAVARQRGIEPESAQIDYMESTATAIPLADASFDFAYCQQGLQHMSAPTAALAELQRLLKPGARLAVAIWKQSPFGLFREVVASLGIQSNGAQPSPFGRESEDLAEALRQSGFTNVEVQQRQVISVLEGGIPQALDLAMATSVANIAETLSQEEREKVRAAMAHRLESMLRDGAVELPSIANIASAQTA